MILMIIPKKKLTFDTACKNVVKQFERGQHSMPRTF